jgi:hypothetical protein
MHAETPKRIEEQVNSYADIKELIEFGRNISLKGLHL